MNLDGYILDRAQPIADAIHDWTGLDCIQQARAMSAVAAGLWLYIVIEQQIQIHTFDWLGAFCVLGRLTRAFFENGMDAQARSTSGCARNPRRILSSYRAERLACASFLLAVLPFSIFWAVVIASVWIGAVLEACDVQTPRKGRIREGLQRFGWKLATARMVNSCCSRTKEAC